MKYLYLVTLIVGFICCNVSNSMPVLARGPGQFSPITYGLYNSDTMRPRIFFDAIINQIDWLPFEVNVPDVISNIAASIPSNVGSTFQRIPIINRITNPNTPRFPQYFMLVPVPAPQTLQMFDPIQNSASNNVAMYPQLGNSERMG